MNKQEITDTWNKLGFLSTKEYHRVGQEKINELGINYFKGLFDPNQMSSRDFWEAADEVFGLDGVCNSARFNKEGKIVALNIKKSTKKANADNHRIALGQGLIGFMDIALFNCELKKLTPAIAEIGAGWGSFKEHFIKNKKIKYQGFDLIARVDGVEEVDPKGYFTPEQVEKYKGQFNIFFTSNVFQHLSKEQVSTYISQISEMLPRGGYLIAGLTQKPSFHYGQFLIPYSRIDYLNMFNDKKLALCAETHLYTAPLAQWGVVLEKIE